MGNITESLEALTANVHGALGKLKQGLNDGSVSLSGSLDEVYPGDVVELIINNYDSTRAYLTNAALGVVAIEELPDGRAKLTYTAGEVAGEETLSVNQRDITFTVQAERIAKPSIVSLADGQTNVGDGFNISSTAFTSKPAGMFTHTGTHWQIATDAGFTNLVVDSNAEASEVYNIGSMEGSTTYYVRVRYSDAILTVESEWSDTVSFTTASKGVLGNELQKMSLSGASGSQLGWEIAVSADGEWAVITCPWRDAEVTNGGGAFLTRRQAGAYSALTRIDMVALQTGDYAGWSVDISDDGSVIAIGAWGDDDTGTNAGSVHLFKNVNGVLTGTKLKPPAWANDFEFGRDLSLSGDGLTLAVGAPGFNDTGGVYMWSYDALDDDWSIDQVLTSSNGNTTGTFGEAVDLQGTRLLVGDSGIGAAYVFDHNSVSGDWEETAILTDNRYNLGLRVALSADGTRALVSSNHSGYGCVTYYTYDGASWTDRGYINDGSNGSKFGEGLAMNGAGTQAIVGSYAYNSSRGYAYRISLTDTAHTNDGAIVPNSSLESGDYYGRGIALAKDAAVALIGTYGDDDGGTSAGAVYVFS